MEIHREIKTGTDKKKKNHPTPEKCVIIFLFVNPESVLRNGPSSNFEIITFVLMPLEKASLYILPKI